MIDPTDSKLMEPPPGFAARAVVRALEQIEDEEAEAWLDASPEEVLGARRRRDSGIIEVVEDADDGPPTLRFVRHQ